MNDKLITPDELAQKLKVPLSWIYRRTRERGPEAIPKLRVGKYYRFDYQAVVNWLESRQGQQ